MQAAKLFVTGASTCFRISTRLSRRGSVPCMSAGQRWSSQRHQSTEVLAPPHVEGTDKEFHPKIQRLVDDISQLTLLEVTDLNELLKKTLNIADAPMMAMGAMPVAKAEEEEEPEPEQKQVFFTVKLVQYDQAKKVSLIKELKSLMTGMNLVQAKKFVESCPQPVRGDITKEEAEELKKALETVGGTVEIE